MTANPQTAIRQAPAKAAPEKAPTVPLDQFRMRPLIDYPRLSDADKKVVHRYFNHTPDLKDFVVKFKELCAAFGVSGMGMFEPPADFWPFVDQFRGIKKPRPFYVRPQPKEDELTHQVAVQAPRTVYGIEFFQAGSRIDYERLNDEDKGILGRWFKSCAEGEEIRDRIQANVQRQLELTGHVESIGYITVPFAFWDWVYQERKRMKAAEAAKTEAVR